MHDQAAADELREQEVIDGLYDAHRYWLARLPAKSHLRPSLTSTTQALAEQASVRLPAGHPLRAVV